MTGYDYQEALKNAAKTMVRVKNPRRLLKMIVRFIVKEVGLNHASILMYDQLKSRYIFVDSQGSFRIPIKLVKLDRGNPLINWFSNGANKDKKHSSTGHQNSKPDNDVLVLKELNSWLSNPRHGHDSESSAIRLKQIQEVMETLKVTLCVPGFYKDELLGVLLLGSKLNSASFTEAEISFFQTLANDASMKIKTAE